MIASALLAGCASAGLDEGAPASAEDRFLDRSTQELSLDATRSLAAGRHRHAAELYAALIERQPNDPAHRQALGYALSRLARWREARVCFEEALRLDPTSDESMLGLGVARYHTGDLEGAREVLQQGLDTLAPGSERKSWKAVVQRQLPGIVLD